MAKLLVIDDEENVRYSFRYVYQAEHVEVLTAATAAKGRYVLIWFTRLPPDGHGHYQVSVYDVEVDG